MCCRHSEQTEQKLLQTFGQTDFVADIAVGPAADITADIVADIASGPAADIVADSVVRTSENVTAEIASIALIQDDDVRSA